MVWVISLFEGRLARLDEPEAEEWRSDVHWVLFTLELRNAEYMEMEHAAQHCSIALCMRLNCAFLFHHSNLYT